MVVPKAGPPAMVFWEISQEIGPWGPSQEPFLQPSTTPISNLFLVKLTRDVSTAYNRIMTDRIIKYKLIVVSRKETWYTNDQFLVYLNEIKPNYSKFILQ